MNPRDPFASSLQTPLRVILVMFILMTAAQVHSLHANEVWKHPADEWKTLGPPRGILLIAGGSADDIVCRRFMELMGSPDAPIVVIPTAGTDENCGEQNYAYVKLKEMGARDIVILHTRDRAVAETEEFAAPLKRAKGVYVSGGFQVRLARVYLHTPVHRELFHVLDRGGVFAGNSAGASIQGSYLYGGEEQKEGFGLVRNSAVGQHYVRRGRMGSMARRILASDPNLLGIGVDEETTVEVSGNHFKVIGDSKVVICDAKAGLLEDPPFYLYPGDSYDMAARKATLIKDIYASKTSPSWKPHEVSDAKGSMLLIGGKPDVESYSHFIELAGGNNSSLVVLSSGNPVERSSNEALVTALKQQGAANVTLLHTINRDEANLSVFSAVLEKADAVWIGGGSAAWKLADSYRQTKVHQRLIEVINRGGVLAGNGAGASLMASRLCDAGYTWDRGYDLLKQSIIWQQPLAERSSKALTEIQKAEPGMTAIGLSEGDMYLVKQGKVVILKKATPDTAAVATSPGR